MSRRREVTKREILPDPKFDSELLAKFINVIMFDGKKSTAERIVYGALNIIINLKKTAKNKDEDTGEGSESGTQDTAIDFFERAVGNVRPSVEVRSRRVGGATYQVPVEVRPARSTALAMRWLIQAARARSEKNMAARLAGELMEAHNGRGAAVKKQEDAHKMAKANQAFGHLKW